MDISSRFSLTDFLAYLFPGIFGTIGILFLLLATPLTDAFSQISIDLITGLVLLAISYILGVILSGFADGVIRFLLKFTGRKSARSVMPPSEFEGEIIDAFNNVFQVSKKAHSRWSWENLILCRSLVAEFMPAVAQVAQRQNGLRQLRRNLVIPTLIWLCAGIVWGTRTIENGIVDWGIVIISTSIILTLLILNTLLSRMYQNEQREALEILLGFLAGYRADIFKARTKN